MKFTQTSILLFLTAGMAVLAGQANAQTAEDQIQAARNSLKADRKATVAEAMQFTEAEGKAFWPLYEQYRAEMAVHGDALLKLVKEYAALHPNVPDARAKVMLKDLADIEKRRVQTRELYLGKIGEVLSPSKTLRFAQVDSRLDLALQLQVAASVPLVPVEGRLTGEAAGVAVVAEGVPGGSVVAIYELTATVAAIDKANRKLTLLDAAGIKKTVKAGPEAVNFDQIKVGDRLNVTATEELVVFVAGEGEASSDGGAQLVALSPPGAKPGGVMVQTTQVTAKVTAINIEQRKATLEFGDGTTRTVAVRPDVDLSKRKVGDKVVIRTTESLAIGITKP